ncbi:hypothetical protein K438DRAFT_79684 [Mycena galopus ATCC 62051]|nr:hypothetical protein K438DRAFT_79684 [Mycena galopus ATCC 62051]
MAAVAPALPATQLCDYCHSKPKNGTHPYCSKTCAAQIATLCNYCHKKAKYQNFDFCGKNCAALAAGTPAAASGNRSSAQAPSSKPAGRANNAPAPQAPANSLLDPVQIAKLVAQHIPTVAQHIPQIAPHVSQIQSFLAAVVPGQSAPPPPLASNAAPVSSGASAPNASAAPQAPPEPLDCLIPGCGKPTYVDASGVVSDYCSKKHREDAVSAGLVAPCIMCLTLPQSETDYFCGRECREEAMSKLAP